MDAEAVCEELAAAQHGVLSRRQALATGLSRRAIQRRASTGRWKVVFSGVYVPRPVPPSWEQRLMAAVLAGGPTALVSHRAAAAVWELDGFDRREVEISVKAGRCIPGVVAHRRRPNDDPPFSLIDGIPVVEPARTLLDLAAGVSRRRLGGALDDALRRGLVTLAGLRDLLASLGPRGRPGSRALAALVAARDERDERLESPLESALFSLMRDHDLPLPTPQYLVMARDEPVARLDLAYPDLRLGIEADGFGFHGRRERWQDDLRRENRLKLLGWTLLRFSWQDVHDSPEVVVSQIRAALSQRALPVR